MLVGMTNDVDNWFNYTPAPWPVEVTRLEELVGDAEDVQALLDFGIRPLSALDWEPQSHPRKNLDKPFQVVEADLDSEGILVDIVTGHRFRYERDKGRFVFDLLASSNLIDAMELLAIAPHRSSDFAFQRVTRPTHVSTPTPYITPGEQVLPLTLRTSTKGELQKIIGQLTELFCHRCPRTTKLWLRGQRGEYWFPRSEDLSMRFYGVEKHSSLLPSLGRYARKNPDKMGFGFSFHGPNHFWKKPFLIWLMRENAQWFKGNERALDVLSRVLANEDDQAFANVLNAIQMWHFGPEFAKWGEGVSWPDEADDLRQWFFARMKTHSFAITLQQYGYVTSLLDLTDDLEIALYFSQSEMHDRRMVKRKPTPGRLLYVFAERRTGDFFRHGDQLFWGDENWTNELPPRLGRQKAGFLMGSTCRTQNFYNNMVIAKIYIDGDEIQTILKDEELFPGPNADLLYSTLLASRPTLEDLY